MQYIYTNNPKTLFSHRMSSFRRVFVTLLGAAHYSHALLATEQLEGLKVQCLAQKHFNSSWEGKEYYLLTFSTKFTSTSIHVDFHAHQTTEARLTNQMLGSYLIWIVQL